MQNTSAAFMLYCTRKKVYVGLALDFYHRWLSHINSIVSGINSGSNDNLVNEPEKDFKFLRVWYPKTNPEESKHDNLLNYETLVMHVFCEMGYELYNGNESGRDDLGNQRAHLIHPKEFKGDRWEETKKCLQKHQCQDCEVLLEKIRDSVKDALNRQSPKPDYCIKDEDSRQKVLSSIISNYLQKAISIKELKSFGLEEMKKDQICSMINSDKIVYHKFGGYLAQSYQTIIRTKQYDLSNNRMRDIAGICPENPDAPVCFWSVKRLNQATQKILTYNDSNHDKRYMLMQYTPSEKKATLDSKMVDFLNPRDGESIEEFKERLQAVRFGKSDEYPSKLKYFFTQQYSVTPDNKNKASCVHYPYPTDMIPSVNESHEIQYIFLISKLYYINAHVENAKVVQQCLKPTVQGMNSIVCTSPIDEKRETLKELLTQDSGTGKTLFLVAELSYPYVVFLPNNPYPLLSHYLGYYDENCTNPQFLVDENQITGHQNYVLCGKNIWINENVTDREKVKELIKTEKPDGHFELTVSGAGDELTEYIHICFHTGECKTIALSNRSRQNRKANYPFGDKFYCAVVFEDVYSSGRFLFLSDFDKNTSVNDKFNIYLDGRIL